MRRLALVALIALASCATHASARRSSTANLAGTVAPSATATLTPLSDVTPSSPDPAASRATSTPTPAGTEAATASLDRTCVHRGDASELQGLTVHAAPKTTIGFSTEYSDHSNEVTNKSYTTGFGYGTTGATGVYRIAWVVPAAAPSGVATVHLIASPGSITPSSPAFRVVAPVAAC